MDGYERAHYRRVNAHARTVERLMRAAAEELARAAGLYGAWAGGDGFSFEGHPALQRRAEQTLRAAYNAVRAYLEEAIAQEWRAAEQGADAMVRAAYARRGLSPNDAALRHTLREELPGAILAAYREGRAPAGSLSDRIWTLVLELREEMRALIEGALREGAPAARTAQLVRPYLQEPRRLFRRVRGADGKLRLSRAAAAYHPGQGVYRSSYMNARRLAITETNIAYRTAEHLRWQRLDFVVGIEVRLSNNHNCKGVPAGQFFDICDELAGRYPKDFKFVGWHPHCRCHAVPILKTEAEMRADEAGGGAGSRNAVRGLPDNFLRWSERNAARIARSLKSERAAYFLRDNFTPRGDGALSGWAEGWRRGMRVLDEAGSGGQAPGGD